MVMVTDTDTGMTMGMGWDTLKEVTAGIFSYTDPALRIPSKSLLQSSQGNGPFSTTELSFEKTTPRKQILDRETEYHFHGFFTDKRNAYILYNIFPWYFLS
jgi:hypothetical protein